MEWKPIKGYPNNEVSSEGDIRNKRTGRILKPYTDPLQEYDRITLYHGSRKKKFMVHILVAEAFIGPRPQGYEIDHLNTDKHDNRVCNLRYVTAEENRNNPISKQNYERARRRRATHFSNHL